MNLDIKVVDANEKEKVVKLSGEIDVYTAPELKKTLLPLTEEEGIFVQVDFTEVSYMDSIGLGVFISALKSSQEYNSRLQIVHVHERILRLFKITGLDEILDIRSAIRGEPNHGSI